MSAEQKLHWWAMVKSQPHYQKKLRQFQFSDDDVTDGDLKAGTFFGKSQKGACSGRIQKLNEDKRAEDDEYNKRFKKPNDPNDPGGSGGPGDGKGPSGPNDPNGPGGNGPGGVCLCLDTVD